jgi:hypothetical protein
MDSRPWIWSDRLTKPAPLSGADHLDLFATDALYELSRRVASTLLPDLLRFDPTQPASHPNNGRALTDDVLDHFLSILTNGKVPTDGVGPHHDLLADFPYVGPPHGRLHA